MRGAAGDETRALRRDVRAQCEPVRRRAFQAPLARSGNLSAISPLSGGRLRSFDQEALDLFACCTVNSVGIGARRSVIAPAGFPERSRERRVSWIPLG